jgi:hypothetical protein
LIVAFPVLDHLSIDLEEKVMDICGELSCEGGGTLLGATEFNRRSIAMRDLEFWGEDDKLVEAADNLREMFEKECPPLYRNECSAELEDIDDEEDDE